MCRIDAVVTSQGGSHWERNGGALGCWRWPIRCTASAWRNVTVVAGGSFHLSRHHLATGKVWKALPGSH